MAEENLTENNIEEYVTLKGREFECGVCEKVFKTKYGVKRHLRDVHVSFKSLVCGVDECTAAFKYDKSLRRHKIKVHGEKELLCPVADCIYRSKDINK